MLLGMGPGWAALTKGLPGHSPSAFPKEDKQPSENLHGARGLLSGPCPGTQPAPTPSPEAPPFVIGGAQLDLVRAFGDDSHPDLVLVDDMWVFQADWERAGCRGWEAGVPVRS